MNINEFLPIASLAIASMAFILTAWNSHRDRIHKRLSVQPRLMVWRIFRGPSDFYGVKLINNGLGPAVLTSVSLSVDGRIVACEHGAWNQALVQAGLDSNKWFIARPSPGMLLRSGEELWVLRRPQLEDTPNKVIQALNRIKICVEYQSLYDEKQPSLDKEFASLDQLIENEDQS